MMTPPWRTPAHPLGVRRHVKLCTCALLRKLHQPVAQEGGERLSSVEELIYFVEACREKGGETHAVFYRPVIKVCC
jgi:hypothetical protein